METSNYSLFTTSHINRSINTGLVQRIAKSIQDIGYLKSRPIIITGNYIIIDGQHRFEACKLLGLPIYYEIENVDFQKAMINLNMNQQIWRLNEYVESWANSGLQCYKYLSNFENKYKLGISNSIVICMGNTGRNATTIRTGKEFEIAVNADKIAAFILTCKNYFNFSLNKNFVAAVEALYRRVDEDKCDYVLEHLQSLKQQPTYYDYLVCFENILNKRKKTNKIILIK